MNIDVISGFVCVWIAFVLFLMQSIFTPKRDAWINMPPYIRRSLWVTGGMFLWRGMNFFSVDNGSDVVRGMINAEGFLLLMAVANAISAIAVWAGVFKRLPAKGWLRLRWAEDQVRHGLIPVAMTKRQVENQAKRQGIYVNATPPTKRAPRD